MPKSIHRLVNRALLLPLGVLAIGLAMGQGSYPGGPGEQPNCHNQCWDLHNDKTASSCCYDGDEFSCNYFVTGCNANLWTRTEGSSWGSIGSNGTYTRTCTRCNAIDTGTGQCIQGESCTDNVTLTWPKPVGGAPCRSCGEN